jgi:hypothetical protein
VRKVFASFCLILSGQPHRKAPVMPPFSGQATKTYFRLLFIGYLLHLHFNPENCSKRILRNVCKRLPRHIVAGGNLQGSGNFCHRCTSCLGESARAQWFRHSDGWRSSSVQSTHKRSPWDSLPSLRHEGSLGDSGYKSNRADSFEQRRVYVSILALTSHSSRAERCPGRWPKQYCPRLVVRKFPVRTQTRTTIFLDWI